MEGWAALHHDDVTFYVAGNLPVSGTHHGKEAVILDVFSQIPVHWDNFTVTPVELAESGDLVIAFIDMSANGLEAKAAHIARFKDGKISEFMAFDDSDKMRKAMKTGSAALEEV